MAFIFAKMEQIWV